MEVSDEELKKYFTAINGRIDAINGRIDRLIDRVIDVHKSVAIVVRKVQIVETATRDNSDTTPEEFEAYANKIARMILSDRYEWACDTLQGIYEWMEEHAHITRKQMRAVDRIHESAKNRPEKLKKLYTDRDDEVPF